MDELHVLLPIGVMLDGAALETIGGALLFSVLANQVSRKAVGRRRGHIAVAIPAHSTDRSINTG